MLKLLWPSIFTICLKLVVSPADGFIRNPTNPRSGMNFYAGIPDSPVLRYPEVLVIDPSDCTKSSSVNDPDPCCEGAEPIQCDYSCPYRKYNGSCNSPNIPRFGMSETCFLRLTPAYYEGRGDIRKSVTGDPLPNPRDISLNILKDAHEPTAEATYFLTAYGQIMAHDLTRADQSLMDCCEPENEKKEECKLAISVRADDPFYSEFHKTCIKFARSRECTFCETTHRTQKNAATATLDASIVYGTTEEEAKGLRANDGTGELKSTGPNKGCLLMAGKVKGDPFCPKGQDENCFRSGDPRVNMHTILTALQTILMRLHNSLARELKEINPHWGEEKLFQEARNVLIAQYQCIAYKEYLPVLLGPQLVELFGLKVGNGPRGTTYYPQVILGVFHEFATAAFRVHSMVPTNIGVPYFRFKDTYSNPSMIRSGYITNLTEGSFQVTSEKNDGYMVNDLSDYLNQQPGVLYGNDLSAIDIQRGRDHGLAPYTEVVNFCSAGKVLISSFEDLYKLGLMKKDNADLLKEVYADVKDVDMLVGMLLEYRYPGSLLGTSATCVNLIQFYSAQKADRFYFDHEWPRATFTPDQRNALKQCSVAQILCENTGITHVTRNPFLHASYNNPDIPCDEVPSIDLSPWKDNAFEADIPAGCSL